MSDLIVVFGGSGFIGRHVVRALAKRGKRIRVATRRPHLSGDLRVMGDVGQVALAQANLRFPESIARALDGADGCINLVGLLFEKGKQTFADVQAEGAKNIAEACQAAGIKRLVHVSAIGADAGSRSQYARAKARAEAAVKAAVPEAVILRPSIVFGPEDAFFNRFAGMARGAPALPLIGGGRTRFQPVFVGDVAEAAAIALDRPEAAGKIYELGGPKIYTFKELLQYIMDISQRRRLLAPLPFALAGLMGAGADAVFKLTPFAPPLTADQVELLKTDNIVATDALTLADLGVAPIESVEAIVPTYLWKFRPHGQFDGIVREQTAR